MKEIMIEFSDGRLLLFKQKNDTGHTMSKVWILIRVKGVNIPSKYQVR